MAVDTGDVERRYDDYTGLVLHRCARVLATAHGGQVLLSKDARSALDDEAQARSLGEHRLRGMGRPEELFQLLITGLPDEFLPLRVDGSPVPTPGIVGGRMVRGYELREPLGQGDFGMVYKAFQPSIGREVAVKVIRPEYANQPDFVRRFEREAQIVAQLEHPHIVPLFDFWRDPDGAYLVMPHLRGGSLAAALRRGGWNLAPALRLIEQVGGALAHAHRRGVLHCDVKPGNVLLDEEGNAYLSDFGIATRLADDANAPMTTSPAFVPPEELRGEPHTARSDVFSLGVLAFQLMTGVIPRGRLPLPRLADARPGLPAEIEQVLARATDDNPANRYQKMEDLLRAFRQAVGADVVPVAEPEEPASASEPARNPYKGLRAFTETDAVDFHGRDALIDELLQAVASHNLVAVVGPSGSGKSSAVRAGLIPALRAGGLPGSRRWLTTDMFPGSYPFEELEAALLRVAVDRPTTLLADLSDAHGLLRVSKRILPGDDSTLVLVIDQFEELFSVVASEATRRLFIDNLVAVAGDDRSRVKVVLTMRADFFNRPLEYAEFAEIVGKGMVTVGPPSRDGLAQAIAVPARAVGVDLEPGLVGRVIADVENQPGGLPLLQYALTEMFTLRDGEVLTIEGYEQTGGVLGALGRRAEELYEELPDPGQEAVRQLFLRLVTVDETAADTRRRARQSELRGLELDQSVLDQALRQYGAFRLLSFDRDPVTRGPTVEVAHEALLQEWDRLRGWIDDHREALVLQRQITVSAQEWADSNRDPSFLLRGARLEHAEQWREASDIALTGNEDEYLAASRKLRMAEDKRRRRLVAGFAVVAFLALALAIWALLNRQQAFEAAGLARSRELAASAISALDEDPELSVLLSLQAASIADPPLEAVTALHEALLNHRAVATYTWPEDRDLDHLSADLSPDGRYVAATGRSSYLQVYDLQLGQVRWDLEMSPGSATALDRPRFSEDGTRLLAGAWRSSSGTTAGAGQTSQEPGLYVWNAQTGELIVHHEVGPCGGVVVDYARAAELALVRTPLPGDEGTCPNPYISDGSILLLDVSTGEQTSLVARIGLTQENTGALSADGRFAGWGESDSSVLPTVWDLTTGTTVMTAADFAQEDLRVVPRALSPDGSLLISGDRPIQIWDVGSKRLLCVFEGHSGDTPGGVGFSGDGSIVISAGSDGTVRLWDPSTCRKSSVLRGGEGGKNSAAITPDGRHLLASDNLGTTARVWSLAPTAAAEIGGLETCTGFVPTQSLHVAGNRGVVLNYCGLNATAFVFDRATGRLVLEVPNRSGQTARLSPDGERLASVDASPEGVVEGISIRDVASGDVVNSFAPVCRWEEGIASRPGCGEQPEFPYDGFMIDMAFSPDGAMLAVTDDPATNSGTFTVWDTDTGRLLFTDGPMNDQLGAPITLRFTRDSKRLVVAYTTGFAGGDWSSRVLRTFDTSSWQSSDVPYRATGLASFTADGQLATITDLGIGIFDIHSLQTRTLVLVAHEGEVRDLSMSPDGSLVASAGSDGLVRVWSFATGELLHEIPLLGSQVTNAEFADATHLLVTPQEGSVLIVTIDTAELLEVARARLTRGFTSGECAEFRLEPCADLAAVSAPPGY